MKVDSQTAQRTAEWLRKSVPKGNQEADELVKLIDFYERATRQRAVK